METNAGSNKGRGKANQKMDSDGSASVKTPRENPLATLDRAAAREKGKNRVSALYAELKRTKSKRTMDLIDGIPPAYRSKAIKVIAGVAKNKTRISYNCEQCVGWEDVRKRVKTCTVYACAFWDVRPHQGEPEKGDVEEAGHGG